MALNDRHSGMSLFVCGSLALVVSWILSGCKVNLGNKVEKAEDPLPYSLYSMQAKGLVLCVKNKSDPEDSDGQCAETDPSKIAEWRSYFTDPIVFYQPDKTKPSAYLMPKTLNLDFAVPVLLDSATAATFITQSYTDALPLFHDRECLEQMLNIGSGQYRNAAGLPSFDGKPVSGYMELVQRTQHVISGNCTTTFQKMENCLKDTSDAKTACGITGTTPDQNRGEHAWLTAFLGPYIERDLIQVETLAQDFAQISSLDYYFIYE